MTKRRLNHHTTPYYDDGVHVCLSNERFCLSYFFFFWMYMFINMIVGILSRQPYFAVSLLLHRVLVLTRGVLLKFSALARIKNSKKSPNSSNWVSLAFKLRIFILFIYLFLIVLVREWKKSASRILCFLSLVGLWWKVHLVFSIEVSRPKTKTHKLRINLMYLIFFLKRWTFVFIQQIDLISII